MAQATRADSAAVLLDAAQRFEREGRSDVAGAIYRQIIERFGETAAAAEARARLERTPGRGAASGGRVELVVFTTLYGLWLGVAVPAAFGADEPEPYGIGLLLGGPAGLLSGLSYSRSRPLSEGQARAITFGGMWGTWQGFGWAEVLDVGESLQCNGDVCFSDSSAEEKFTATIAGGLAGILTGAVISRKPISPGVATTVNFGALWGTWFGLATGAIADLDDDDLLAATLIGGDAGLLSMALLAPRWNLSRNRARLISISGVIGGLAGAGIDLIVQPDNSDVAIGIPLTLSIAGLMVGSHLTRNYDAQPGRGGEEDGEALLRIRDGRVRTGFATPLPLLRPVRDRGRPGWRLAAYVPVLSVRF